MYKELQYVMPRETYKKMLAMDGIGSLEKLIAYINETYGLLGIVTEIVFDD